MSKFLFALQLFLKYFLVGFSNADNVPNNEESKSIRIVNEQIGTMKFVNNFLEYLQSQGNITLSKDIFVHHMKYYIRKPNNRVRNLLLTEVEYNVHAVIYLVSEINKENLEYVTRVINFKIAKIIFKHNLLITIRKIFKEIHHGKFTSIQLTFEILNAFMDLQNSDLVFTLPEIHLTYYQHYILHILFSHQYDCITGNQKDKIKPIFTEISKFLKYTFMKQTYFSVKSNKRIVDKTLRIKFLNLENNLLQSLNENLRVSFTFSTLHVNILSRELYSIIIYHVSFFSKIHKDSLFSKIKNFVKAAFGCDNRENLLNFENEIVNFLLGLIVNKNFKKQNVSFLEYKQSHENKNEVCIKKMFFSLK